MSDLPKPEDTIQQQNLAEDQIDDDQLTELIWSLVDETIDEKQMAQLEDLLKHDPQAREIYIRCMALHADLHTIFDRNASDSKMANVLAQVPTAPPAPAPQFDSVPDEGSPIGT